MSQQLSPNSDSSLSPKTFVNGISAINDFVVKFANVNGTGSASANAMFVKGVFRMGVPVSPRNIFPSNIQGLPTWYEVRISEQGYMARREGVDLMVAVNAQTFLDDVAAVNAGGYLLYDSTKPLIASQIREDIHYIGIPLTRLCLEIYGNVKARHLYKNILYLGAVSALLDMDLGILEKVIADQFKNKPKLIEPNVEAVRFGRDYALKHYQCPLAIHVRPSEAAKGKILVDGNTAAGLGALYSGATVVGWYPITPSTSLVEAFTKHADKLRLDSDSGGKRYLAVQAEDELAAIGIVIGAAWNGARSFTATSGPGLSLMAEFLGLAYFAEVPAVLFDVQRSGPSTGMPTRTQQCDILCAAYASHGDSKHILLIPDSPNECFTMSADAFDLADHFQTPVIVMSDLDIGMQDWVSEPLEWDDNRKYNRGKVYDAKGLDEAEIFGRYLDVDGDGVCYRTYPGTHESKGAFFTRGTSRDEFARYTESSDEYVKNVERLTRKFKTAAKALPAPEIRLVDETLSMGVIYYGSSAPAVLEAREQLAEQGIHLNAMRIKAFPFHPAVEEFIARHDTLFLVEQNRDAQMQTLLLAETEAHKGQLFPVLHFGGMPLSAEFVTRHIEGHFAELQLDLKPAAVAVAVSEQG